MAIGRVRAALPSILLICLCFLPLSLRNHDICTAKHEDIDWSVSFGFARRNPQRNGQVPFIPSCCVRHLWYLASVTATGRMKKRVFTHSRIPYYSNHSAVFNIELIRSHGDIHPHPGPSVSHHNHGDNVAYGNRNCRSGISIFYANSRSLVNKTALLEFEITITAIELFHSNYMVFR